MERRHCSRLDCVGVLFGMLFLISPTDLGRVPESAFPRSPRRLCPSPESRILTPPECRIPPESGRPRPGLAQEAAGLRRPRERRDHLEVIGFSPKKEEISLFINCRNGLVHTGQFYEPTAKEREYLYFFPLSPEEGGEESGLPRWLPIRRQLYGPRLPQAAGLQRPLHQPEGPVATDRADRLTRHPRLSSEAVALAPSSRAYQSGRGCEWHDHPARFGHIDRRTQEGSSRLHALLYACHPRLVNGPPT